jgi:acetyl esterase/lipase
MYGYKSPSFKMLATMITLIIGALTFVVLTPVTPSLAKSNIQKDIAYGSLGRQKLDVYMPKTTTSETQVLFFLYGGSWDSGNKSSYAFMGKTFSKEGFITVVADYRLYPKVTFPAFVNDAALAFAKTKSMFPDRQIFISGHSAGAQIGALLTLDDTYLAKHDLSACRDISGFIGIAGPYDFEIKAEKFRQIFPEPTRPQSQAVNFTSGKKPPVLLLHGKRDTTVHPEDSVILSQKLKASGNDTQVRIYNGIGHINIIAALTPMLGLIANTRQDMTSFMKQKSGLKPSC